MLNAIFASRGLRVLDMESTHVTVRQHTKIYASAGAEYGLLFGDIIEGPEPASTRRWKIPIPLLHAGLEWMT